MAVTKSVPTQGLDTLPKSSHVNPVIILIKDLEVFFIRRPALGTSSACKPSINYYVYMYNVVPATARGWD